MSVLGAYYERLVREDLLRSSYLIKELKKGANVSYLKSWWKNWKTMSKCKDTAGKVVCEERKEQVAQA